MANKNTKLARRKGYCNYKAYMASLDKNASVDQSQMVFKGQACNTAWDNPNSKRKSPKRFKKKEEK